MADTNRIDLRYAKETTFGTAPSGSYPRLRVQSESLQPEATVIESTAIRNDRQTANVKRTNVAAGGDINGELSYTEWDELIQYAIQGAAIPTDPADTSGNWDISSNVISTNDWVAAGYVVGDIVRLNGFADAANNGAIGIVSAVTTSNLTIDGPTLSDETTASGALVEKLAATTNGTTDESLTIEREYTDTASTEIERFAGMSISGMSVNVPVEGATTIGFSFVGKNSSSESSNAGTPAAASTNVFIDATGNCKPIIEGSGEFAATSFSFTIENNLRARQEIGKLGAQSVGSGKFVVTGTLTGVFENSTLVDKFLNQTLSQLALPITDDDGNSLCFYFPSVRYTAASRVAPQENQDVIAELSWQAFMDSTQNITMRYGRHAV